MSLKRLLVFLTMTLQFICIPVSKVYAFSNPATVPLLTVSNFAALAHTLVSSPTGPTLLNNGDLGVDTPGTCTGFPSPCTATGNGLLSGGTIQYQNGVALQGQTDATAAVTNIGLRASNQTLPAQLGGQTLSQGVYTVPADATNLTGDLTLTGDADSVFIFHLTSTLITDNGSRVLLTGGVQACHVFWKIDSSATFNGTTTFVGTVLAATSVTFPGGGATLTGRAVAQTAGITFNNTTVNNITTCSSATAPNSTSDSSTSQPSTNNVAPCVASPIETVPMIIGSKRISPSSIFINWGPFAGLNTFNVRYGLTNGEWLYNTNVTGFSATINDLPPNQPIWLQVAATNNCSIGTYGEPKLVGGPTLPNTGFGSPENSITTYIVSRLLLFRVFLQKLTGIYG